MTIKQGGRREGSKTSRHEEGKRETERMLRAEEEEGNKTGLEGSGKKILLHTVPIPFFPGESAA